jgi:hypothetical protein
MYKLKKKSNFCFNVCKITTDKIILTFINHMPLLMHSLACWASHKHTAKLLTQELKSGWQLCIMGV